jgi:hypothetical protein
MFVIAASAYCAITVIFAIFASDSVQAFNYKSYAGVTTTSYFTSGEFLEFPVRATTNKEKTKDSETV